MTIDLKQLEDAINKSGGAHLGDAEYTYTDMKTVGVLREAARAYLAQQKSPEQDVVIGFDMSAPEGDMSCLMIGEKSSDGKLTVQHCVYGEEAEALYRALNTVPALQQALTQRPAAPNDNLIRQGTMVYNPNEYVIVDLKRGEGPAAPMGLEALKRELFMEAPAGIDISPEAASWAIDHLASKGMIVTNDTLLQHAAGDKK